MFLPFWFVTSVSVQYSLLARFWYLYWYGRNDPGMAGIWTSTKLLCFCIGQANSTKVINSVPYQPYRPKYTVPASNPVHSTPLFRIGKNTGRTGFVPANFGQYRPVPGVPASTEKSFYFILFYFIWFYFKFCNFWIFVRTKW